MTKTRLLVGFALGALLVLGLGADTCVNPAVKRDSWPAQIQDCYESNVCNFRVTQWGEVKGDINVRIAGIATPSHYDSKCPQERALATWARVRLNSILTFDKNIMLHGLQKDTGSLWKATIEVEGFGKDVGQILIDEGFAVAYQPGDPQPDWCEPR